jgi:hypothetical protein
MPYTNDFLAKLDLDEALKIVLMDVYTADQYSVKIRDTAIETAISQIKQAFENSEEWFNRGKIVLREDATEYIPIDPEK